MMLSVAHTDKASHGGEENRFNDSQPLKELSIWPARRANTNSYKRWYSCSFDKFSCKVQSVTQTPQ